MAGLLHAEIQSLKKVYQGKVRECFAVGEDKLLMVATDRISAFDVILSVPIPNKGKVLTGLTAFWFDKFKDIIPTQMTGIDPKTVVTPEEASQVEGRAFVVKRLKPILIECVARGYIIGSGWKDYQATGAVCGVKLPAGLKLAQKLDEPIFTPAAKAEVGVHDENISYEKVVELYGEKIASTLRDKTLALYKAAADFAATKGIIIADTKFEFGIDEKGEICLMDEVLTPDSSRFWPANQYEVGMSPPSFDKQFLRDWLETQKTWNKTPPAPVPPAEVLLNTEMKYREALIRITGHDVD